MPRQMKPNPTAFSEAWKYESRPATGKIEFARFTARECDWDGALVIDEDGEVTGWIEEAVDAGFEIDLVGHGTVHADSYDSAIVKARNMLEAERS